MPKSVILILERRGVKETFFSRFRYLTGKKVSLMDKV